MLTGTLLDTAAILIGSVIGLALKWANARSADHFSPSTTRHSERIGATIMQGIALCVLYIGITGCLKGENALISILSMVLGGFLGECLDLDRRMEKLGSWVQKKAEYLLPGSDSTPSVSEGFVTATLIFCVGAMSIVGALENGLTGRIDTLQAKSLLDFVSAIIFASSLGIGVLLSAAAVLLYQGSISLLAAFLSPILGDTVIAEMGCTGSLLIVALALNLLGVTNIKVMNFVPAIFLPVLFFLF